MKLIASGVTFSAARVRSPSFSRSSSSITTIIRPARISSIAVGTSVKGELGVIRRCYPQGLKPLIHKPRNGAAEAAPLQNKIKIQQDKAEGRQEQSQNPSLMQRSNRAASTARGRSPARSPPRFPPRPQDPE